MTLPFVLFVNGINDQGLVQVIRIGENNQLVYNGGGSCDLFRHLKHQDFDSQNMFLDGHSHTTLRLKRRPELVFNEISNPDSHRLTLQKSSQIVSQLNCPILNHPDLILRTSRDQIYMQLKDIPGVIAPLTLRCVPRSPQDVLQQIADSELHYPVIVRECGLHNSENLVLLEVPSEIATLNRFAFDGREFYLIQYIDGSQSGVFSKYRVVVVDGRAYFRHARYHDHWNVGFFNCLEFLKQNPDYLQKEKHLLEHFETEMLPNIHSQIAAIYQRLKLDYFGIDFALTPDNHMQIFEVNANMLCLDTSGKDTTRHGAIARIKQAVIAMLDRHIR